MMKLPTLNYQQFSATRDCLQDAAKVLGKLQQVFLEPEPHDWQRGLLVDEQGLKTQPFSVNDQPVQARLNLIAGELQLAGSNWSLNEYDGPELFNNVKVWLQSQAVDHLPDTPEFATTKPHYDQGQAAQYGAALNWLAQQFVSVKKNLGEGLTSPLLIFPHHFDVSLTWFPHDDERQLSLGWSTGDETIAEPYLYITAYPEPAQFIELPLAKPAYWQSKDFSGAVLEYRELASSRDPAHTFAAFADLLHQAVSLYV